MVSLEKRRRRVKKKKAFRTESWETEWEKDQLKIARCIKIYLNSIFILHKHLYLAIGLENISTPTDSCALERRIVYTRSSILLPYFWPVIGSNHSWVEHDFKWSNPCPILGSVAIATFQYVSAIFQFSQHFPDDPPTYRKGSSTFLDQLRLPRGCLKFQVMISFALC